MSEFFRMIPNAGDRQHHTFTGRWRYVCRMAGCYWRSTERDTAEEVDLVAAAHLENAHGATQVIPTP